MSALPAWNSVRGSWQLDSTLMCGYGWQPVAIEELWVGAPVRVTKRRIPGVNGVTTSTPIPDERVLDVQLRLTGVQEQDGTPYGDPVEGFNANVDILSGLTGSRTSTITRPDSGSRVAAVVVENLRYTRLPEFSTLANAVLTITIPGGAHYAP